MLKKELIKIVREELEEADLLDALETDEIKEVCQSIAGAMLKALKGDSDAGTS
jgi:hypothetical protein